MRDKLKLTNGNIILRPCFPHDAEALYAAIRESIADMSSWAPWCPPDYSMAHCKSWLESRSDAWSKGNEYDFIIFDAIGSSLLGGCGIYEINRTHNYANLGYWVRSSQTGKGVATAAAILLAKFGLDTLGFTRIEIVAAVDNNASQRVAEKAGAKREGIERNRHVLHGKIHDAIMFSLVPEDIQEDTTCGSIRTA